MSKKKAKKKGAAKKSASKKSGSNEEQDINEVELLKDLSTLVKSNAPVITQKVIDDAKSGQLAPVRYLFELANIYPQVLDGTTSSKEEDSLAKTLLERMGLPTEFKKDAEDEDEPVIIRPRVEAVVEKKEAVVEKKEAVVEKKEEVVEKKDAAVEKEEEQAEEVAVGRSV